MQTWPVAGGHGVDTNHSLAYDYYLEAHDMGHWRAPYALAVAQQAGLGVAANCSTAWQYFQIFIKERSSWTEQMELALLAVDTGVQNVQVVEAHLSRFSSHRAAYSMHHVVQTMP